MASNPIPQKWTYDEYIAYEIEQDAKYEMIHGEIYMMTGGTHKHSLIIANCLREVGNGTLESDCYPTSGDLRVEIDEDTYVYPDFLVICGEPKFKDDGDVTLKNPTLVAEVVSDSSQKYDTGLKSEFYRGVESVEHYLIIHQKRMLVQVFTRDGDAWHFKDYNQWEQTIPLTAINATLPIAEVYRRIDFEADK